MITSIFSKPELFWFLVGLGFFLAELIIPGFFIFFFGLGAWITAFVCLIGEPGTNLQILIFAVSSVASLIGLRRIMKKKFFYNKGGNQVDVDDEFTGREALAVSDFGGQQTGKVEFKGTLWQAESKTGITKGQRVIITGKENFKLIVEPKI
jgi:membrane protein implicated in regulation of membrane protease activity